MLGNQPQHVETHIVINHQKPAAHKDIPVEHKDNDTKTIETEHFIHPQCGNGQWQRFHSKLQMEMLKRPLDEQRITIFDAYRNGAGDRMTMTVTAFMHALLSNRAFKIKWTGIPLSEALMPNWIDWRYNETDDDPKHGIVDMQDYMTYIVNYENQPINLLFSQGAVGDIGGSVNRTVVWRMNQGQLWTLFDNPLYRDQLYQWGFRPETAFGCVMSYLFQMRAETIQVIEPQWKAVLQTDDPVNHLKNNNHVKEHESTASSHKQQKRTLNIGLQLRFGDRILSDQHICDTAFDTDKWAKKFFSCAEDLQLDLQNTPNTTVNFVLISDCEALREAAVDNYDETTMITSLHSKLAHTDSKDTDVFAFRKAISEMFLFSFTDYQIVSAESSFAKVGSWSSLKWNNVFTISNWSKDKDLNRQCHLKNFDQWREYSRQWIRM